MLYFLYFFLSPYPLFCSFSDVSRNLIMTSGRRWLRGAVDWWAKFDESLTRVKKGRGKVCILAVLLDVLYAQHTGLRTRLITLDVEVVARTPAAPPGCSTWTHPPAVWWSKVAPEGRWYLPPLRGWRRLCRETGLSPRTRWINLHSSVPEVNWSLHLFQKMMQMNPGWCGSAGPSGPCGLFNIPPYNYWEY